MVNTGPWEARTLLTKTRSVLFERTSQEDRESRLARFAAQLTHLPAKGTWFPRLTRVFGVVTFFNLGKQENPHLLPQNRCVIQLADF